ncbi:MAG TPA: protein kinase [Gemmatimonadales bacterium]|nr:protein kinase [Gemmatimonadales bacterium]
MTGIDRLTAALADRYQVLRELGAGGMATVYLAQDLKHDRRVAIKVLRPELAAVIGADRFLSEIKTTANLQHPHILGVFDSGDAAGQLWYAMPYVRGESLRDRLARERRLPVGEALRITREAAQALQHAHAAGVVHRDIKPENILLTEDGSTLVADFGIARSLAADDGAAQRLTDTGLALGTPAYMSPEQALGDRTVDARTDQYALATVCWEMLAGALPFTGATASAVVAARLTAPAPSVRTARPEVADVIDHALRRALATMPEDRFPSVAEFASVLRGDAAIPVTTPMPPARPARRARALLPVLLLGLLGLGGLFAARRAAVPATPATAAEAAQRRLAVLPFINLGDTADAYFADGVTDAVRGKLTALPGLTVIASTSSDGYRDPRQRLEDVARELGVRYLLVGKVRWAKGTGGSRVQVSPELVEIAPDGAGTSRWQRPFDAALTDVFQVQGEIATHVARELDLALGATQRQALGEPPTRNLDAYDAYLRGLAAFRHVTPAGIRDAVAHFRRAAELDSTFGQAWAVLARAHMVGYLAITPSAEAARNAGDAIARAMRHAPDDPLTTLARAMYASAIDKDLTRGRAILREALRAQPNQVEFLRAAAHMARVEGEWKEALEGFELARALDPRVPGAAEEVSRTLLYLRRYEEAERAADAGLAIDPTILPILRYKAMARLGRGDLDGAKAIVRDAHRSIGPLQVAVHFAVYNDLYWLLDSTDQRRVLQADAAAFGPDPAMRPLVLAQLYHLRGERALSRAYGDSAAARLAEQVRDNPRSTERPVLAGLALALAGRADSGLRVAESAIAREPYVFIRTGERHKLVRLHLLAGDRARALDELEGLLDETYFVGPAWLRIDPDFAPLHGDPRFERLVAAR